MTRNALVVALALCGAPDEQPEVDAGVAWQSAFDALRAGEPERALTVTQRAIEELPDSHPVWPYLMDLAADAERRLFDWEPLHRRLDRLEQHVGLPPAIAARARNHRTEAFFAAGRLEAAERALDEQRRFVAESLPDDVGARRDAHNSGVLLDLARGRPEEALESIEQAISDGALYPTAEHRATLLHHRALAEIELERFSRRPPGGARATLMEALSVLPEESRHTQPILLSLADIALHEARFDDARAALDRCPAPDDQMAIALAARRARLDEVVVDERARHEAALDGALRRMMSRWRASGPRVGGASRMLFIRDRAVLAERLLVEEHRAGAAAALELLAEVHSATTLALRMNAAAPAVEALQDAMPPGRGLLVFVPPVSGGSLVFALDRDAVVAAPLPDYHDLERLRRAWSRMLHRATPPELRGDEPRVAAELGSLLIPDVIRGRLRRWSEVTLVGLDAWPLAWLSLDGARLGVAWSIARWPSLAVGAAIHARPEPAGTDVALIADPIVGPEVAARYPALGDLPPADEVERSVRRHRDDERVETLRAEAATVDRVIHLARGAHLLQFVGHAVSEASRDEPTALVLTDGESDDGLFRCEDARRLVGYPAPFAVALFACSSGAGPERLGDAGAADLPGAFLTGGVGAILAPTTDLSWRRAADLSASLHRGLSRGLSIAEWLRRERASLVDRFGADAPWHDAGLEVVGDGHRPVFAGAVSEPRPTLGRRELGGALIVAAVLLGLYARSVRAAG